MVFHLYRNVVHKLLQHICDIAMIPGRRLEGAVVSVFDYSEETVIDRLDYPEVGYIKFYFSSCFEPPRLVANRHIIPW